jgi:TolB-like protein
MRFLFDGHVLDIDQRELRRGAEPIALEPLVFDLLVYLVANRDRVVSKDNLLDSVWSGRIVSESALASRIAAVRRAIGDSGETQNLIKTISRKGFRFVGDVHEELGAAVIPAATSPARDAATQPPGALASEPRDMPSIAVLAFENMSSDPEQEYFSDGMADDIITELSRDRSLFVIARNSSFTYKGRAVDVKQIASELGVRYVLEGSTRRNGRRIRVNAQLIDAPSGNHLWAQRYDRGVEDVFAVRDEIAADVVRAILPTVANAERQRAMRKAPDSLSAWEAWQRALWHWSGGDLPNSRDFLERAIALDPRFAPPYAMLAWLYLSEATTGVGPPFEETLVLAQVAARTAIELDHDSGIAHAMLAWVLDHQRKGGSALEEAETAINLSPNDPQGYLIKGHVLMLSGRPAEARDSLNIALRLDPHGPIAAVVLLKLSTCDYFERDYVSAEATARRVIRAWPEFPRPYLAHAAALGQIGSSDEARAALDAAIAASPFHFEYRTRSCPPYIRPEDHEHLLDGLRKAGWRG